MNFRNAFITAQKSYCLVPKVFNSVDAIFLIDECLGMLDPHMMNFRDVEWPAP